MQSQQPISSELQTMQPPYKKLFAELTPAKATSACLAYLGQVLSQTLDPDRTLQYVRILADLQPRALCVAFERAERECEFFPAPATLRRMGGAQPAELGPEKPADEAWAFVTEYVRVHGIDGHERMAVTSPGCYRSIKAPEIPKAVRGALSMIGSGVRGGLLRFASTQAKDMGHLRRDFDAAFARQFQGSGLELVVRA